MIKPDIQVFLWDWREQPPLASMMTAAMNLPETGSGHARSRPAVTATPGSYPIRN